MAHEEVGFFTFYRMCRSGMVKELCSRSAFAKKTLSVFYYQRISTY